MLFGAHVSIAGGVQNAPLNAAAIGCEVFQMFSRSPQGGPAPALTPSIVKQFKENCAQHTLAEWVIHAPYYINLASSEARIRGNTIRLLREELERGSLLDAAYVMFHPGSARDLGQTEAMASCIAGLKKILRGYRGSTRLLIEMSAGAGMVIGDTFEELAEMIEGAGDPELGVCLDTAHAFASGYDLRTPIAVKKTLALLDKTIGLKTLKMIHANDSKVALGARRDRHEHIGDGLIGLDGFRALVGHGKLQRINFYLETEGGGVEKDLKILKKLRGKV